MLDVTGLTKKFDDLTVFERFDITVPRRGFTVIIGPSGCGKSTLFDVLTGVVPRDDGVISWQGKSFDHLGGQAAYMQQKDLLLPWLPLMDNALLPVKMGAAGMANSRGKAVALFKRLGLRGFESYLPGKVSGGMRQRCALVRTLMFERELVLLDEPLSALDAITRSRLQSLLLMLQSEFGKSILMITHDIEEAILLGDQLLVVSPLPMGVQEQYALNQPKPREIDDPTLLKIKAHVLSRLKENAIHE
ncbi:Hydroxymethylpyrimidine ABC transporter, ATPase component [Olavius algarvensis associated proteobacterium Delta 3]|nr:Hydroxymethylpyrimidine ABC transporter, ATPase component [Olavius algarvensis associated proteobacterium Delta 3]CAB5164909.1 Hydroxymethylpyrimidine ABC transporter, ATPase component [Olavius algarvensis associated proteobacterium Delta 3]